MKLSRFTFIFSLRNCLNVALTLGVLTYVFTSISQMEYDFRPYPKYSIQLIGAAGQISSGIDRHHAHPKETHPSSNESLYRVREGGSIASYRLKRTEKGLYLSDVEIHHIGFLKVHKAGSSMMQNIFLRFALNRNLTLALPLPTKSNYFSTHPLHYNALVPLPKGRYYYDILACHSVFNELTYSKVLEKDSVYIGIVRHPLRQMISAAYYFRNVSKESYLENYPKENFISSLIRSQENTPFSFTKNSMARDFGFTENMAANREKTNQYLSYLNDSFSLVLLMDEFEMSLVMMRRLLNWKLKDVIYIAHTLYVHNSRNNYDVSEADVRTFQNRNALDYVLYDFFKREFIRKASLFEEDFPSEVVHLKTVQTNVEHFCLSSNSSDDLVVERTQWNEEFVVRRSDCDLMSMQELDFIELHRQRMLSPGN